MLACEYCQIFKDSFFYRTPPVHYTFPKFYVMMEFFRRLWEQNWHFSCFLCHCFIFLYNCSVRIGVHGFSVLVFIPKLLVSGTFARNTRSALAIFFIYFLLNINFSQVEFVLIHHPKVFFGQIWSEKLKFFKLQID